MPDFMLYMIKANLAIMLFYGAYHFLLRRLTFHTLNRYYLLFAMVFSVAYPLINAERLWSQRNVLLPETAIVMTNWQQLPEAPVSIWPYIQTVFLFVMMILGMRFLFRLASLRRMHLKATPAVWQAYQYFQTGTNVSPFSFWKYIYVYPSRHKEHEMKTILEHEQTHVDQLHSIDVLLAEIYTIVFWFNPFAWLLRRGLSENLEFITDRKVLQNGLDAKSYQYDLLNNLNRVCELTEGSQSQPYLGNNFNFKSLKNRIIMMNKERSSQLQLGKYLLLIPIVVLLVSAVTFSRANKKEDVTGRQDIDKNEIRDTVASGKKVQIEDIQLKIKETIGENPLYVIDGVPQEGKKGIGANPENIATISVLKGHQATSIFGSKGKNGVIIVTTKNKLNAKDSLSFGANNPRIFLDGKEIDKATLDRIDPNKMKSIDIVKAKNGNRGTMTITTKKN